MTPNFVQNFHSINLHSPLTLAPPAVADGTMPFSTPFAKAISGKNIRHRCTAPQRLAELGPEFNQPVDRSDLRDRAMRGDWRNRGLSAAALATVLAYWL